MKTRAIVARALTACAGLLVATLLLVDAAYANLVVNGGFETGDFFGWAVNNTPGACQAVGASAASVCGGVPADSDPGPHGGLYAAYLGQAGQDGSIQQSLATTPGEAYSLDFWLANLSVDGKVTPNHFQLSWNGTTVTDLTDQPAFGYTEFKFSGLVATDTLTPLVFSLRQDPGGFVLDDVSVTAQVPEPGVAVIFAIGLAGVAALKRWRRG